MEDDIHVPKARVEEAVQDAKQRNAARLEEDPLISSRQKGKEQVRTPLGMKGLAKAWSSILTPKD